MVASVLFTFTLNSTHLFHAWIYNDEEITTATIPSSAPLKFVPRQRPRRVAV